MKIFFTHLTLTLTLAISLFHFSTTSAQNNPIPPGWEFQATSSNPHGMIVMLEANPRINDIPLEPGDYIGAFFIDDNNELKCAGADFWLGDENIIFAIFGDDYETPEKDGFGYAEEMNFMVYSYTTHKSYDIDVTSWDPEYYSTNKWSPLGLSAMIDLQCIEDFDAYASANPNPACLGDEVTLSANIFIPTTGNYSYTWSSIPVGFSSTNAVDFHTPSETTTYLLEVNDGILTSSHELTVEVNQNPTADAGADMTICHDCSAELSGNALNYSCIMWQTSGDGTFDDASSFYATYFPGENDLITGEATLTMNANAIAPCDVVAADDLSLTIQPATTIGIAQEFEACGTDNIFLNAEAQNYASILWTTDGDGTFSNPDQEETQYFPGTTDEQLGEFVLTVCATPVPPAQGDNCVDIEVVIFEAPVVNAPATITKCDNLPITVTCIPHNYSSVMWSTDGDGTFEDPELNYTSYYAGTQDRANGNVNVTVQVYGSGPCQTTPVVKTIAIGLYPSPIVDAGDTDVVCSGESLQLSGSVTQSSYFKWITSGDGYFSNTTIENPLYFPGSNDLDAGSFTLSLKAYPISPCYTPVIDELVVDVVGNPYVEIITENNQSYATGTPVQIEAIGEGFQSLLWETSGDGTFSDPGSLSPEYYPGPAIDASGNPVTLTITAFAAEGCGVDMSDQIDISFTQQATVEAGNDMTACDDGAALNGSSQYCNAFLWETSGDGTFVDPTAESTTYIPGSSDVTAGFADVCLTGYYGSNQSVNDCLTITISKNPTLDAGFDQMTACYDQQVTINLQTAENYSSIFWYTTNGGGLFCNNQNGSVLYTPAPNIDYPQECISIYALAQPLSPCTLVGETEFELCFVPNPELDAGFTELNACYDQPVGIELENAENYSSLFWYTTNGGGSFVDLGAGAATYYPSALVDYPQGCVDVYVLAQPITPCSLVDEAIFSICFQANPEADAGEDATINELETFTPQPSVTGQGAILWQTSGDGTFSDATALSPEYFPGSTDIQNGDVQLSIAAYPTLNCTITAYDEVHVTIHSVQTITIPEGWSGLSSYIDNTVQIEELFAPIENSLITAQTITQVYWPAGGINTIGMHSVEKAYKIRTGESCELTITGPVNEDKTIVLNSGWNLIPVISKCYVNQYDFLDALGPDLMIVKEIAGNGVIWPDMGIYGIPLLTPGNAYLVSMNTANTFTFDECNSTKQSYVAAEENTESPWEISEKTTLSHTVAFTTSALKNLEPGDFIGAFTADGLCVGTTEIINTDQNAAMAIFGDEPMTKNIEGMTQGENIYFKVFSNRSQTESELDVIYNESFAQSNGTFAENGVSVIHTITLKPALVDETIAQSISIYPNPSNGKINLSIDDAAAEYQVTISDMRGHKIIDQRFTGNTQLDLSDYPKGFYLVIMKGGTYQQIEKLILD